MGARRPRLAARKSARRGSKLGDRQAWAGDYADSFLRPRAAARGQDLAAADGRHPGAEAVTALAHEIARLEGALHRSFLVNLN